MNKLVAYEVAIELLVAVRAADIKDPKLRALNNKLLAQCGFQHIQAAVDAVTVQRTNIYVLPGLYREEPSHAPACTKAYDGGVVEYDLIVSCGEVINLVTIAGDSPADPDTTCDNALCRLQIEGTGPKMTDVVLQGGFTPDGDWVKHNGIKADGSSAATVARAHHQKDRFGGQHALVLVHDHHSTCLLAFSAFGACVAQNFVGLAVLRATVAAVSVEAHGVAKGVRRSLKICRLDHDAFALYDANTPDSDLSWRRRILYYFK